MQLTSLVHHCKQLCHERALSQLPEISGSRVPEKRSHTISRSLIFSPSFTAVHQALAAAWHLRLRLRELIHPARSDSVQVPSSIHACDLPKKCLANS